MTGGHQRAGKWTTPFGPNVRYTVRLHVVGEDRDERGTARGADRYIEYRIVTPHGELRAAASAAAYFGRDEPNSIFREIEVVAVEDEFEMTSEDYRDVDSLGR